MRLIDAARCPYCARVRIAVAEKGIEVDPVPVDLSNRPSWLLELNPPKGRVPVLVHPPAGSADYPATGSSSVERTQGASVAVPTGATEDAATGDETPPGIAPNVRAGVPPNGFVLPESEVIMTYLEELQPEPPLLPKGLSERAEARLLVYRFDELLGDDYYAFRRGEPNELEARLDALPAGLSLFSDVAFAPWVIRARDRYGAELPPRLESWLAGLAERRSFAAELEVVSAL